MKQWSKDTEYQKTKDNNPGRWEKANKITPMTVSTYPEDFQATAKGGEAEVESYNYLNWRNKAENPGRPRQLELTGQYQKGKAP